MPAETLPSPIPMGSGSVSLRLYPHNELPATEIVDRLCTMAATAAEVGFDGVMTSEHHGGFAGYLPNPLQVTGFQLSAMARGWAAAAPVLLPLRPMALLAEEVAWLDARFPGRVGIGVGPGSLPLDFEAMDADLDDAVPRFKRDLPRLAAMLPRRGARTARGRPGSVGPRSRRAGDPDGEHRHEPGRGAPGRGVRHRRHLRRRQRGRAAAAPLRRARRGGRHRAEGARATGVAR